MEKKTKATIFKVWVEGGGVGNFYVANVFVGIWWCLCVCVRVWGWVGRGILKIVGGGGQKGGGCGNDGNDYVADVLVGIR